MKISITHDDINQGVAGNPHRCPIARAAKRAFDDPRVTATAKGIYGPPRPPQHGKRGNLCQDLFPLPPRAKIFMDMFDAGKNVQEMEFSI